jgi:hypothetical protein
LNIEVIDGLATYGAGAAIGPVNISSIDSMNQLTIVLVDIPFRYGYYWWAG